MAKSRQGLAWPWGERNSVTVFCASHQVVTSPPWEAVSLVSLVKEQHLGRHSAKPAGSFVN